MHDQKNRKVALVTGASGGIGSEIVGYQPAPNIAAYAASKSYVLNFSDAIAMELEDYGVSVSCYSPGLTDTNFFDRADISKDSKFYA